MEHENCLCEKYEIYDWKHAIAILKHDYSAEWKEICEVLHKFELTKENILEPGGRKSPISKMIDSSFYSLGWEEKSFGGKILGDEASIEFLTHKIDCFKNRIALEIEWNNKDTFYDRDLNNFRLLFNLNIISVGIIITRSDRLQSVFNNLGKGNSYGASTTHMSKLLTKINNRFSGGCPVLAIGLNCEI